MSLLGGGYVFLDHCASLDQVVRMQVAATASTRGRRLENITFDRLGLLDKEQCKQQKKKLMKLQKCYNFN